MEASELPEPQMPSMVLSEDKHCPSDDSRFPRMHSAGASNFTVNFNITKEWLVQTFHMV